jgi:hypothetical protein
LLDLGRKVVAALGYTGMFCIDTIEEGPDSWVFLEINPRVFGAWECFRRAGQDFLEGYEMLLGRAEQPSTVTAPDGQMLRSFPLALRAACVEANRWSYRRFLRESIPAARSLGMRYWVTSAIRFSETVIEQRDQREQRERREQLQASAHTG